MSQLQIELDKLEEQLKALPQTLAKSRVRVAEKAAIAYELMNGSRINGLKLPYYDHIKRYGRQRALIIERTTSRLNPYNINGPSFWTGNSDSFSFPTNDSFIFYCFDEDGNPITFNPATMYLITTDAGDLAGRFAISLFLREQADQTVPAYTTSSVSVGGDSHDKLTFATPFPESFSIGQQFALMESGDNIGYIQVGIEGLYQSASWDPFKSIDFDNQSQIDAWFSEMMTMTNTSFETIAGEIVDGSVPEDDVLRSSDSTIRSDTDNVENSPFFPALNANENDWPSDFDNIDTTNRRLVINGNVEWSVYPRWRWENKLIPNNASGVNTEGGHLNGGPINDAYTADIRNSPISPNEFPVNDLGIVSYAWYESDDKVKRADTFDEVDCVYNSVTDLFDYYDDNDVGGFLDGIISDFSGFTDTITPTNNTTTSAFINRINDFKTNITNLRNHHNSWFVSGDNGDINKFNSYLGDYDRSLINGLFNFIDANSTMFDDRIDQIESIIGSAPTQTGYVGEVIDSSNMIVSRSYGVVYDLNRAITALETVKDLAVIIRKKYDGLSGS